MNVCAKCGAPMAGGAVSCPQCGGLPVRRVARVSVWQRVMTGVIGLPLLVLGLSLMTLDPHYHVEDNDWDIAWGIYGGLAWLFVWALFVLAAFVPFHALRRTLVGVGWGLGAANGAMFVVMVLSLESAGSVDALDFVYFMTIASFAAIGAFSLAFYLSYRLAR